MNNRPFAGRTAAVIDLAKLRSNIANIKSRLKPGVEFIAVMKGDGYRHGIAGLYPTLKECGIDSYAVAIWEEGKMLRDTGATESILILGDTADDMLDEAAKYDLDLTVFSMEGACRCKKSRQETECPDKAEHRYEPNRIPGMSGII